MAAVWDNWFLLLTLLVTFIEQLLGFLIAAGFKIDKVTDLAYGTNFVILAGITLFVANTFYVRQLVITTFVMIWGIRLALYLFYRIIKIGEDKRFDAWREHPLLFLRFWIFQFFVVWIVFIPVAFLNANAVDVPLQWNDWFGWSLYVIGFLIEAISDQQKFSYRNDPANKNHWCDTGLWKWSRHPNYFGEILIWWGIWISTCSVFKPAEFASIVSPIVITASLLFLSGITRLEQSADKRFGDRDDYKEYKKRTSVLILFPPGLYSKLGTFIKKLCCCEWSIYDNMYDPEMKKRSSKKQKQKHL